MSKKAIISCYCVHEPLKESGIYSEKCLCQNCAGHYFSDPDMPINECEKKCERCEDCGITNGEDLPEIIE